MDAMNEKLYRLGIVPVVVLENAEDAIPLGKALINGGLPVAEVTFRTAAAEESIRKLTAAYPDMLVGAGTVLTTEQADRAIDAGAKFIVSPGLNPKVVSHVLSRNVPVIPGVLTPTVIEAALELGLNVLKFFPAESFGGLKTIKALAAPYGGVRFMPTGGINADNVRAYLASDKILACGGSWMVKGDLIKAGRFDEIEKMVREASSIVKEIRG